MLTAIGIKLTLDGVSQVESGIKRVVGGVGSLKGALGALVPSLSVGAMLAFLKQAADGIDALNDVADGVGTSVENISALERVARNTGTTLDTVSATLLRFNKVLADAKPESTYSKILEGIGLSVVELRNTDPAEALLITAKALSQYADDGNKARIVQELFGKSVKEVAPFLKDLADSGELVATVTRRDAEQAELFNKQLAQLSNNATLAGRSIAADLLPTINSLAEYMAVASRNGLGLLDSMAFFLRIRSGISGMDVGSLDKDIADVSSNLDRLRQKKAANIGDPEYAGNIEKNIQDEARKLSVLTELRRNAYKKLDEAYAPDSAKLASLQARRRMPVIPLDDPKSKSNDAQARRLAQAELAADLAEFKRQLDGETDVVKRAEEMLQAQRQAGLLSDGEYYRTKIALVQQLAAAQVEALQQERERVASEKVSGAERITQQTKLKDLQAQINKVQGDAANQVKVLGTEQEAALRKAAAAFAEAQSAAEQYLTTLQRQYGRELAGVGRGDKARREMAELNQIDDRYESQRQGLAGERRRGEITEEDYSRQLALIDNYNAMALDAYRQHYADLDAAQGNWLNGANDAFANYRDSAADVAGLTKDLFTNSFQGLEDGLVSFVTTGKFSFADLANSIVADITRIIIKQQISNALGLAGGAGGSGLLGLVGSGVGALFGTSGQVAVASAMPGNAMDHLMGLTGGFGTMSFDGGGYTGNGPRVGGIDGKGGFWALMHPQETVVDHTKGQSAAKPVTVVINQSISGPVSRQTENQIAAAAQRGLMRGTRNL